jgi:hypothetical protein
MTIDELAAVARVAHYKDVAAQAITERRVRDRRTPPRGVALDGGPCVDRRRYAATFDAVADSICERFKKVGDPNLWSMVRTALDDAYELGSITEASALLNERNSV